MTRSGGRTGSGPTSSTCGCCTWRPRPASVGRGGALRARLDAGATCDYATSRPRCHSVLWAPAYALVQELLGAKRDLDLPRAPSASSTRTPRGRDRIRRAELSHGPLPPKIAAVTCAPRPCSRSAAAPGPPARAAGIRCRTARARLAGEPSPAGERTAWIVSRFCRHPRARAAGSRGMRRGRRRSSTTGQRTR